MKTFIPALGMLFIFGYVAYALTQETREIEQALPQSVGDLTLVRSLEIRDAGGQVILSGEFTFRTEHDGDVKGVAPLAPDGGGTGAIGGAEIEVSNNRNGVRKQELDVEVKRLNAGAAYGLYIDGRQVTTFNADGRGAVDLELTNEISATETAR